MLDNQAQIVNNNLLKLFIPSFNQIFFVLTHNNTILISISTWFQFVAMHTVSQNLSPNSLYIRYDSNCLIATLRYEVKQLIVL